MPEWKEVPKGRKMRFDEEGEAVVCGEDEGDAPLMIGAWSAPAAHKKVAYTKQQKEQREREEAKGGGKKEGGEKKKGRGVGGSGRAGGKGASAGGANNAREGKAGDVDEGVDQGGKRGGKEDRRGAEGKGEQVGPVVMGEEQLAVLPVVQGCPDKGDFVCFKTLELAGWLPTLSGYKQAVVESVRGGSVACRILLAEATEKVKSHGPRTAMLHPSRRSY